MPDTSEQAVSAATGRGWEEWFRLLDDWGARTKGHAATARHLAAEHGLSGWWSQEVTVMYERSRGLRVEGQAAGGFQVGVRRTVELSPEASWSALTSARGLRIWLGEGAPEHLEQGADYALADGSHGQVRVVRPGSHLRITWQPPGWERASTIQVRVVSASKGRAALSFHHEKLPDAEAREAMRARWKAALSALSAHPTG